MPDTYSGVCSPLQSTMESCAKRIDSLRQDCTKSYGTLTAWPGPCECSYYAQDLMCFDEQELCASQVWTQVPTWFRDGVTSCLGKDENYTVRAQLGTFSDPFTVAGLAGSLATPTGTNDTGLSATASPGATISGLSSSTAGTTDVGSDAISGGAIAGAVVGSVSGAALVVVGAFLLYRRRKTKLKLATSEEDTEDGLPELHAKSLVLESDNRPLYEKHGVDVFELPQHEPAELFTEERAVEVDDNEMKEKK